MADLKFRLGQALSHLDEYSGGEDEKLRNILKLIIETQDALIDAYNAHTHDGAETAPSSATPVESVSKSGVSVESQSKMLP